VQKAVIPGPAKALGQHMAHQQSKKLLAGNCFGAVLFCFSMEISVGDSGIGIVEDILFSDHPSVQISAQIDERLFTGADMFAINNPLLRVIVRWTEVFPAKTMKKLCPEDLCQRGVVEEVFS